ncbi:MAG TPA: DciA family protein [Candidatus Omnitrophota bacterium]|jgi:predicted nucleic acid-binding Zn ribbon protein|nr:DciA family protein [Candidatus Omnitrophota bacterium]HSA30357.1 DciA family protein [Candidatus Omnitrophota bacterium]
MEDIKSILEQVMGGLSQKTEAKQSDVKAVWEQSIEVKMKEHTQAVGIKKDIFYVVVDCSAWMYQCRIQTKTILKKIQHHFPNVEKIHLKIGKVR